MGRCQRSLPERTLNSVLSLPSQTAKPFCTDAEDLWGERAGSSFHITEIFWVLALRARHRPTCLPPPSPPLRPSGFSSSPLISRTVNGLNLAGEWLIPSRLHLPTSSKGDVVHLFLSESEQTSTSLLQLGRSSLSEPRVAQLWISNQPMGSRDPGEGGGHLQFNPILISSRVVSSLSAARARG